MGTDAGAVGRQHPLKGLQETKQNSILPRASTKELLIRIHTLNYQEFLFGGGAWREGLFESVAGV